MYKTDTGIFNSYRYLGAIHIHTRYSDGTGDVYSISKAAKKAGLDWIIITDHNSFDIEEGIYNGVYVIKGEEISPDNNSHYLAFGINEVIVPTDDIQANIDNVRKKGGFGFAAHPDESKCRKNKWKPIVWKNKNIIPDGVEIWNWFSNWGDNLNDRNIFKLAYSYLCKHNIITNPAQDTMDWWDELNRKSLEIIPAIGGVDAHALKIYKYIIPVTVFPYKMCFQTITNVITINEQLSENFDTAKQQILNAIKQGNNIIVNRKICKNVPQVFISNSESAKNIGESVVLTENTYLNIQSQKNVNVKVLLNGKEYKNQSIEKCRIPITECGKYRVEFLYSGRGFAYTNPILVKKGQIN